MLSFFRTNHLVLSILLILYALIYQVSQILYTPSTFLSLEGSGVLSQSLEGYLSSSHWLCLIVVAVLLLVQGTLANLFFMEHRVTTPVNLFPGVFLILFSCLLPEFLMLSAYHFANVFLLLGMLALATSYRKIKAADNIFNAGLWIGLATLFQPTYFLFILVFIVSLAFLRTNNLKESIILLLGALCPIFLIGFYFFWTDRFDFFMSAQFTAAYQWPFLKEFAAWPWLEIGIVSVAFLLTMLNYSPYQNKTTTEVRKKMDLIYWLQLGSALVALFTTNWSLLTFLALMPFIGMLLSISFTRMKAINAEIVHLVLIVAVIGFHFAQGMGFF